MIPPVPIDQTLLTSVPQTPVRDCDVPELWDVHVLPFHLRIVPLSPTAQTLLESVPQIPNRFFDVPEFWADQALPFHRRIVPRPPTDQRLFASVPQTDQRSFPCGKRFCQHQLSALHTGMKAGVPPSVGAMPPSPTPISLDGVQAAGSVWQAGLSPRNGDHRL